MEQHMDHAGHHMMDDHGMHDAHQGMDHSAHGDYGAESAAQHHPGHDGSAMEHMGHMMHSMTFHFGCNETILFDQWKATSPGQMFGSVIVIAVMAALYEGLKYYREYLFWKTYNSLQYRAVTLPDKSAVVGTSSEDTTRVNVVDEVVHCRQPPRMTSPMHFYQTFLHVVQVTLSFLLMLIFMTYNYWLCSAVVIGAAIGYFLFGWKKSVIVDITEHCH